ncbi:MAG: STAS domain-containing protein [Clostridiales bacterium]|nr:STAS domain-containing protein [Clostridiales bacterium]
MLNYSGEVLMKIKYNLDKNTLNISLVGELDECSASRTRDAIESLINGVSGIVKVVFDLSLLTFMDSTGIGMFIGRYKKLKSMGISTFIKNPNDSVEKILQISGLYQIMPRV